MKLHFVKSTEIVRSEFSNCAADSNLKEKGNSQIKKMMIGELIVKHNFFF